MNNFITKLLSIINRLSSTQRIILIVGAILVIFIFWHRFLWDELKKNKNDVAIKISAIKTEIDSLKAVIEKQKQATDDQANAPSIETALPSIADLQQYAISGEDIHKVLTSMLNTKKNLNLLLELRNLSEKKISDSNDSNTFIYENDFVIKFNGDYSSTINYLKYLEQLPSPLFLDAIEYNVIKYPTAEVKLQLHIFSNQGGFLRV
jgi:MSHA biogenesis protein MshJ